MSGLIKTEYIDYIREVLSSRSRKKEARERCECSNSVSFWKNMFESMDRENVKLRIKIMELERGLNKGILSLFGAFFEAG